MSNTSKAKPKKKGSGPPLYQETAIKYFEGFMKSKRYNKGVNLSTGCAIFKTAWELPESNGLVLPSRVVRHFKQVLPKKPKAAKKGKTGTKSKSAAKNSNANSTVTATATVGVTAEEMLSPEADADERVFLRSRTMVDIPVPKELSAAALADRDEMKHEETALTLSQRRTMVPMTGAFAFRQKQTVSAAVGSLQDKIEDAVQLNHEDEQVFDEELQKAASAQVEPPGHGNKAKSIDFSAVGSLDDEEEEAVIDDLKEFKKHIEAASQHRNSAQKIAILSSNTSNTPTPDALFEDHADIIQDDLKPDTEELAAARNQYTRAQTDVKHMHDDELVSFKAEIIKMKEAKQETENVQKQQQEKSDNSNTTVNSSKGPKKKKKGAAQVLYAEDATKLFKKINDGKRFKNGLTLSKACNIFSVAWELPEENGRILPSKVQRHFKQVLPSKKSAKKAAVSKANNTCIKPSVAKSRTHRGNVANTNAAMSIQVDEMQEDEKTAATDSHLRAQSMRGEATMNWKTAFSHSAHALNATKAAPSGLSGPSVEPKKSMITQLEALIAADPHRSNADDHEGRGKRKRERAGSMTDLGNIADTPDEEVADDHVVEDDIGALLKEVQRQKAAEKEAKLKEQEQLAKQEDAANAIDASLGK